MNDLEDKLMANTIHTRKPFLKNRWLFCLISFCCVLVGLVITACFFFGIYRPCDIKGYIGMTRISHSGWNDLAWHRLYAGQPVDEAIQLSDPISVERHGNFAQLNYQESGLILMGITVLAREDKLVFAQFWSCTWEHVFF